jgi:tetratricopeptide (TPR) repeat protein
MAIDLANAIVAWDWAVERKQVEQLNLVAEVLMFFSTALPWGDQGEAWFQPAADMLAEMETQSPGTTVDRLLLLSKIHAYQGLSYWVSGRADNARQSVQQSYEILEHPVLVGQDTRLARAGALRSKGIIELHTGDREVAKEPFEQSLALYRKVGYRYSAGFLLHNLGGISRITGLFEKAIQLYQEALTIQRASGVQGSIADTLVFLAVVLMQQGNYKRAEDLQRKAVVLCEETGSRFTLETAKRHLALTLICSGRYSESCLLLKTCVGMCEEMGKSSMLLGHANTKLAHAYLHLGQFQDARRWGRMGLAHTSEMGDAWGMGFSHLVLGRAALANGAYTKAQHLLQEGANLLCDSKNWDFAYWALPSLAHIELVLGQIKNAEEHLRDALQPALEKGHGFALMSALPVIALLQLEKERAERAVEIYALASRYGHVVNSRWWEDVAGKQINAVAFTLPSDVVAAAQERGRARNLEKAVAEWLAEI